MSPEGNLLLFTIYHRPVDFPDAEYAVRAFIVTAGEEPTALPGVLLCDTLEDARAVVPPEADACISRSDTDPPTVVETWL